MARMTKARQAWAVSRVEQLRESPVLRKLLIKQDEMRLKSLAQRQQEVADLLRRGEIEEALRQRRALYGPARLLMPPKRGRPRRPWDVAEPQKYTRRAGKHPAVGGLLPWAVDYSTRMDLWKDGKITDPRRLLDDDARTDCHWRAYQLTGKKAKELAQMFDAVAADADQRRALRRRVAAALSSR